MALNWNITAVKNTKSIQTKAEWPVTDMLIWATMFVGFHTITEKNWREFYARLHFVEVVSGCLLTANGKPYYIKPEEVKRRIGLSTNAADFGRAEFLRRYGHKELDRIAAGAETEAENE